MCWRLLGGDADLYCFKAARRVWLQVASGRVGGCPCSPHCPSRALGAAGQEWFACLCTLQISSSSFQSSAMPWNDAGAGIKTIGHKTCTKDGFVMRSLEFLSLLLTRRDSHFCSVLHVLLKWNSCISGSELLCNSLPYSSLKQPHSPKKYCCLQGIRKPRDMLVAVLSAFYAVSI